MTARRRSANWGGPRSNAGRKPILHGAKTVACLLEPRHIDILERYGDSVDAPNRSEALRNLLDMVEEDYSL